MDNHDLANNFIQEAKRIFFIFYISDVCTLYRQISVGQITVFYRAVKSRHSNCVRVDSVLMRAQCTSPVATLPCRAGAM